MRAILTGMITAAVTLAGGFGLITTTHVALAQRTAQHAMAGRMARADSARSEHWGEERRVRLGHVSQLPKPVVVQEPGAESLPAGPERDFLLINSKAVPPAPPPQYPWLAGPPPKPHSRHRPPPAHTWIYWLAEVPS